MARPGDPDRSYRQHQVAGLIVGVVALLALIAAPEPPGGFAPCLGRGSGRRPNGDLVDE